MAAFTYGDRSTGVANSVLEARRRTVAAAVASTSKGQDIDMVLMLADEREVQALDPAFDANVAPVLAWAEAVWSGLCPMSLLQVATSRAAAALTRARHPWSAVRGPAGALLATAARLGWQVVDASTLITDAGRRIDLHSDPPVVVKAEVIAAVTRWRWRRTARLAADAPEAANGGGFCIRPLRWLLRPRARKHGWAAEQQAALRSAVVNAQWPQQRLYTAGLVDEPWCQLCAAAGATRHGTAPICAEPPRGTLLHRMGVCDHTAAFHDVTFATYAGARRAFAARVRRAFGLARDGDQHDLNADDQRREDRRARVARQRLRPNRPAETATAVSARGTHGHTDSDTAVGDDTDAALPFGPSSRAARSVLQGVDVATWRRARDNAWESCRSSHSWARALVPMPTVAAHQPPEDGTFVWKLAPAVHCEPFRATMYTDASAIDAKHVQLRRFAWAFTAVDDSGEVIAEASGVPPPWVESIAAAEAWAIHAAASAAAPGSAFITDCATVANLLRAGRCRATAPTCKLARVMMRLFTIFDSPGDAGSVIWMPAHTTSAHVGRSVKSDGSVLTRADQLHNERADAMAKAAVKLVRARPCDRAAVIATEMVTASIATNVGRMTWAANNRPDPPHRDAAPPARAPWRHLQSQAGSVAPVGRPARARPERPPTLGGHLMSHVAGGVYRCAVCWVSSANRARMAAQACGGSIVRRWAAREAALRGAGSQDATSHRRWMLGDIVWCARCGAYASHHAVGLAAACKGPPLASGGGRTTALARLRRRLHPKTGLPVNGSCWPEPTVALAAHASRGAAAFDRADGFIPLETDFTYGATWGCKQPGDLVAVPPAQRRRTAGEAQPTPQEAAPARKPRGAAAATTAATAAAALPGAVDPDPTDMDDTEAPTAVPTGAGAAASSSTDAYVQAVTGAVAPAATTARASAVSCGDDVPARGKRRHEGEDGNAPSYPTAADRLAALRKRVADRAAQRTCGLAVMDGAGSVAASLVPASELVACAPVGPTCSAMHVAHAQHAGKRLSAEVEVVAPPAAARRRLHGKQSP